MRRKHWLWIGAGVLVAAISINIQNLTHRLDITGSKQIQAETCSANPYTISIKDTFNKSTVAPTDLPITLIQNNPGPSDDPDHTPLRFFADSSCSHSIDSIEIAKGTSSTTFYIRYASQRPAPDQGVAFQARIKGYFEANFKLTVLANAGQTGGGNGGGTTSPAGFTIGYNQPANDPDFQAILADATDFGLYKPLFQSYSVDHLRFPGGTLLHYYFWDDDCQSHDGAKSFGALAKQLFISTQGDVKDESGASGGVLCQVGNFEKFLSFSAAAGIKPIIGLNGMYYHDGTTVHEVEHLNGDASDAAPLPADRWNTIDANIKSEVQKAHSILGSGVVQFEISNEEYAYMPAANYGEIVEHYTNDVKSLYPQDQVLVSFSKGNFQHAGDPQFPTWNADLIAYLEKDNFLPKLDYFVLHYYHGASSDIVTQTGKPGIDSHIMETTFSDMMKDIRTYFPSNYSPKFSLTEFSPSLTSTNSNFNTQTNAMLVLDFLMKFHSDPAVASVSKHTGINSKNGSFFTASMQQTESNLKYLKAALPDSVVFPYISPQAKAMAVFEQTTGATPIQPITVTSNYELLATQTGNTKYVQILNFESSPQTISIAAYGTGAYTTYAFPSLLDHTWDTASLKSSGSATQTITVPGHSFTGIVFAK